MIGERSWAKLLGVHPDLVRIVMHADKISSQEFAVICGVRTKAQQVDLYAQGRTRPGDIVTWTMTSRHFAGADGYGRAVDLCPYPVDWNTPSKFDAIANAMFAAAKELGVEIRWGADWDRDGNRRERGESDNPHFELV